MARSSFHFSFSFALSPISTEKIVFQLADQTWGQFLATGRHRDMSFYTSLDYQLFYDPSAAQTRLILNLRL